MALHSPSRFSSAFRSADPAWQVTARRSHRPSSRRFARPYDAPSPRNPLPGRVSSPGATVRLSPLAGTGRLVTAHTVAIPPYLVAGFHTRFGPPPPFLTTMTACSSSDPVECFVHSRPWGSVPAPWCIYPVGRSEDRPSRCSTVQTSPKFVPLCPRGRVLVQEAPGRSRDGQLPKHPSSLRGLRSHRSSEATEVAPPSR
jgi:hypothetical protein